MQILIYDSVQFSIPLSIIHSLNTIYEQCFRTSIHEKNFNHLDNKPYMLYFVLINNNIVQAFCKIIFMSDNYELYDVCRRNPHIQNSGLMLNFLQQCFTYFYKKYWNEDKQMILAIRNDNKYKEMAIKLYEKCGFVQTKQKKLEYQEINEDDIVFCKYK